MQIRKNSGELVPYNPKSLKHSLSRSGADKAEVEQVLDAMNQTLYDGMTTRELYQKAFDELKRFRSSYAARYSLKRAVKELGPEGYFFEKWIAKLFAQEGYEATSGVTVQGTVITHEIDVVAANGKELVFCECKFRNDMDAKISVTTPMYILSRLKDVQDNVYDFFGLKMKPSKGFLVTNAYFTTDSIKFSEHYGIGLISWNYPENTCLKARVDDGALYPLTCLTVLTSEQEKQIMDKGIILVKELVENPQILKSLGLNQHKIDEVLNEANELLDVSCLTC